METEDTTCIEQEETPQEDAPQEDAPQEEEEVTTCTECTGTAHEDEGQYWHGELVCCGCFSELVYFSIAVDVNTDREGATA